MLSNLSSSVRMTLAASVNVLSFSAFLRLNGVNAKEHPVFRELARVKQYFEKLKASDPAEDSQPRMRVDQPAAGRILKHALVTIIKMVDPLSSSS